MIWTERRSKAHFKRYSAFDVIEVIGIKWHILASFGAKLVSNWCQKMKKRKGTINSYEYLRIRTIGC